VRVPRLVSRPARDAYTCVLTNSAAGGGLCAAARGRRVWK
jgi:hypothetical protein